MKVRLFPGGPEFPAEFLDAVQKGEVVFFCGAGLSVGTGLPTFSGLVRKLDGILNPDPNDRFDKGRTDYDRMLDELEEEFMGGRGQMREHVREILSAPPPNAASLENHRSILKLAAVPDGGFRLVTTNFDDRFALANGGAIQSKDWPELPPPRGEQWASLVHLHGRICGDARREELILTASDFGGAYIRDRRAADFVIDLLRRWPMAFVGYGLNDPPMGYLIRAVYDSRNDPGLFRKAFALVGCGAGEEGERRREWEGKRVVPILYDGADGHAALRPVLRELARLKNEPGYRAELAVRGTNGNPDDEGGDNGRRVVWALRDFVAAENFAGAKIFADTKDGGKFVHWLDAFKKAGLFRADNAAPVDALDCPPHSLHRTPALPPVARYLAFWAARHAHQPALLWWLAGQPGFLHPRFVELLGRFINGRNGIKAAEMSEELAEMWNLHLQEQLVSPPCGLLLADLLDGWKKSEWVKSNHEQLLLASLRPRPRVIPDAPFRPGGGREQFKVKVTIDCEMDRANDEAYHARKHAQKSGFVMAHAEALAAHLEDAASLMKRCDIDTLPLRCFRPEEDDDYGDGVPAHWLFLTLLVRDAVLGMIKGKETSRLKNLVPRWMGSEHLLMRRLALFTVTETANLPKRARLPADWGAKAITARPDMLWALESGRESCRFLRKAGAGITPSLLAKLECVIREGPPRPMPENIAQAMRWEVAKLLAKLELSGARLSPESARVLADARAADPVKEFENFMEYPFGKAVTTFGAFDPDMPELPGMTDGRDKPDWKEMTVEQCADHIQSKGEGWVAGLVKNHPDKAVAAFEMLAKRNHWGRAEWSMFLGRFGRDKDISDERATRLVRLLDAMPDELAFAVARNCASVLQAVSQKRPFSEVEKAWRRLWNFDLDPTPSISGNHHISALTIAINHAHGELAEIALRRLGREDEREKLLGVLAEILAGEKPSHEYGKIVVGRFVFPLFRDFPEWTRRHLLPFFAPEHPLAVDMWESFLHNPGMSADFLDAVKPALLHFMQSPEVFHDHASQFMWVFLAGCVRHPGVIPPDERRKVGAKISPKGLEIFCENLGRELRNKDSTEQGKKWREWIFPLLQEVWPERRRTGKEASDISRALASVVVLTGDAFPEASQSQWAQDFLSPIVGDGHPRHPVTSFLDSHQEHVLHIPAKFPRECLLFLNRIVPDEGFYHRGELHAVLDKIKAAAPDLEKDPAYIRLRKIASGG